MTFSFLSTAGKLPQRVTLLVFGFVFFLFIGFTSQAQPLGEPGDLGPTPASSNSAVPVDGGASLLAMAAAAYAGKRLRNARKNKELTGTSPSA